MGKGKEGIASIRGNLFGSPGITSLSSDAQLYLADGLVVFVLSWKVIIIISFNGEALKVCISFQNYWRFPFFHGDVKFEFHLVSLHSRGYKCENEYALDLFIRAPL